MATSTLSDRDVGRIWIESRCNPKTIERYLRNRGPVRDASRQRIIAAMKVLGFDAHIPPEDQQEPAPLAKTG